MEQITKNVLDATFARIIELGGEDYRRLTLHEGSQTYGRAWRLYFEVDHGGLSGFPGLDNGYLGWTRREAYQTLRGIEAGMEAQRLLQAQDIRDAAGWVAEGARDGGGLLQRLHKLAPPNEF